MKQKKRDIIAAMDEVINKLDSDGDNSFKKDKKELLTRIKNLYTAERTKKNFDLFVKTANIHENFNFGGQTNSFKIFQAMLKHYGVTSIEIPNERFKDLKQANNLVDPEQQSTQVAAPAAPLNAYKDARRSLIDKAVNDFSGLIGDISQKQEIVNQFKAFLNDKYPEPQSVEAETPPLTLADHNELIKDFYKKKFEKVLKFPTLHGFLKSDTNTKSIFAKNLRTSFNSSSSPLYGLYAGLMDLVSRSESNNVFLTDINSNPLEVSNDEAQVGRSSSTASNASIISVSSAPSEGADTAFVISAEAQKFLEALSMMYEPQYATLTAPEGFQLNDDDISSYTKAMDASIEAVSSMGSNQKDKKNILIEIKDLFEKRKDTVERYRLISMFIDVANKHRFSTWSLFASKETSSFKKFMDILESKSLWTKLKQSANDSKSPTFNVGGE